MLNALLRWWHSRNNDRRIRKHGWTAIYVGDYVSAPTWVYTVGIDETLGQPELVIFDVPIESANEVLWRAFQELKQGLLVLEDGKPWLIGESEHPVVWRRVHRTQVESPAGWFTLAEMRRALHTGQMSGLEVFQLVLSDREGRLPWEPGYDEALRAFQPALYLPLTGNDGEPMSLPGGRPVSPRRRIAPRRSGRPSRYRAPPRPW